MSETVRITLALPLCSGCGACHELAPDHFAWNEAEDRPVQIKDEISEDLAHTLLSYCPEGALEIEEP